MIHYSCDRCGRTIDTNDELRFVVRMEVEAVMAPLDDEINDEDRDYLMEISDSLENGTMQEPLYTDGPQQKQFDLCSECHCKFKSNPIGSNPTTQLNFSEN